MTSQKRSHLTFISKELEALPGSADALVRRELGDDLSFEPARESIVGILSICEELQSSDLAMLPEMTLAKLVEDLTTVRRAFRRLSVFSVVALHTPAEERKNAMVDVDTAYHIMRDHWAGALAYDSKSLRGLTGLKRQATETLAVVEDARDKAQEALSAIRDTTGSVGVETHAEHFDEAAEEHDARSKTALRWTVILGAVAVAVGVLLYIFHQKEVAAFYGADEDFTIAKSIQMGFAKLAVLSVLYVGAFWVGRIYKAHRHNYVVNIHRRNALRTFKTFVESTDDPDVKNAILLQAARSIFTQQPSGYLGKDGDTHDGPQILEVIRSMTAARDKPGG